MDEISRLKKKTASFFKNTNKDIIMSEKDGEHYRITNFCRFRDKQIIAEKVRNPCHLTGQYRSSAHQKCDINVTQKKVILYHLYSTFLVIMILI